MHRRGPVLLHLKSSALRNGPRCPSLCADVHLSGKTWGQEVSEKWEIRSRLVIRLKARDAAWHNWNCPPGGGRPSTRPGAGHSVRPPSQALNKSLGGPSILELSVSLRGVNSENRLKLTKLKRDGMETAFLLILTGKYGFTGSQILIGSHVNNRSFLFCRESYQKEVETAAA